jgi:dienelactone hydrolase
MLAFTDMADSPAARREAALDLPGATLPALVGRPPDSTAVVVFAHGSYSSRLSARNRYVAATLNRAGIATLLLDLLTGDEALDRRNVFDIPLLARRLEGAAAWVRGEQELRSLPLGIFGASTGAAAALVAAADLGHEVAAVVSRGGRPDLAAQRLSEVRCPTLLVVGGCDSAVLELNRSVLPLFGGETELSVVPGATHLFGEPGALERVAELACAWFTRHLGGSA